MRNKVVLIRPFFNGHFLPYFQLFLNSCRNNPDFDWILFTDNEDPYDFPPNVHKIYMTFDEAKELFQSKFDFPINLPHPYKIHDFKAAFGYVFSDYIKEYDFWGQTDYDVIYGDLSKFITDEMLDQYDKLFVMGHFALYRNTQDVSMVFQHQINGKDIYKEVLTSEKNMNFDDEWGPRLSVNDIFRYEGRKIYENPHNASMIADIYDKSTWFKVSVWDREKQIDIIEKKKNAFFAYVKGRLVRYEKVDGKIIENEYMYIHLIHRKMRLAPGVLDSESFSIIPDVFEPLHFEIDENTFHKVRQRELNFNYFKLRWNNLKTKVRRKKAEIFKG